MAVATAAVATIGRQVYGTLFEVTRDITFDNSYVTGGEPVPASAFGLSRIVSAFGGGATVIRSGFSAAFAFCDVLTQTDGSALLRLRAAAGTEVPNATDASTVAVRCVVRGY